MKPNLADVQGLIASGYGDRPAAAYALFCITDATKARSWLGRLMDRLQFADFLLTGRDVEPFLKEVPLNIAFTHAGLSAMGLPSDALAGFGCSFREGMAAPHRARQLGDDGASDPQTWLWGGPQTPALHGVLCAFAGCGEPDTTTDRELEQLLRAEIAAHHGLALERLLPAQRAEKRHLRKEHFGFRDGVSNPPVDGLPFATATGGLKPGEVLLGHENAYGHLGLTPRVRACDDHSLRLPPATEDPTLRDFGSHGSYLVFRQLEQHVATFWRYVNQAASSLPDGKDGVWLASRMVGRWPDGSAVTLFPERDSTDEVNDVNDFLFADHGDAEGQRCPIGSHIRRTNPRDTMLPMPHDRELSGDAGDDRRRATRLALTNAHRIVRRGRPYGPPLHPELDPAHMTVDDGKARGLYFLCFNANLRRQFEFVQSSWVVNPSFGGLAGDPDPLLAAGRTVPFEASDFTLQGCPARRVSKVPRVVETRGGAYFFMPSRNALLFLSELLPAATERVAAGEAEAALALAQLHVDKIERHFAEGGRKRARRGFHAKSHGIVRATLNIDPDLAPPFRVGVFMPGARYSAWVRFSSGAFGLAPDTKRDVHGLAIKLMGVPDGPRAASFERHTQDFVLIDAPSLMVGTVRQALAFDRAQARGRVALLAHLATHPDQALAILSLTSAPRHLFERQYTSVTAFAHGPDRAVRYVVRVASGQTLVGHTPSADGLRSALSAQLARGPLRLELCLQTRGLTDLPIEDARVDWRRPAQRVATLTLHPEGFGSSAHERAGERMSFNPWNALDAHRPLGGLNRARRVVYRMVYELRSRLNGERPYEPSTDDGRSQHDHQTPG